MTSFSPSIDKWNACRNTATRIEDSIQETSAAYADVVKKLTDGKVGTLQERLEQYRTWLAQGKVALDTLEQGVYKEFCERVEELLANSDDREMKMVPIDSPANEGANRVEIIADRKEKLDTELSRIRRLVENGLEFCDRHANL
ncbi:hypothetical protein BLS_008765 [Venturia inaequalis]|uniref:Uncharacterized protein n=1 Tax=Venturia inaequalis TaxID=5025 RepID=A0A8H3V483_VENIN|nr:hypothetical protein EG328_003906 [Venturia inaequalis]KAE9980433.1 hypothetical protein BLS_008765 [Venturia inaequalis]KAE9991003.1 hypothetical protein EG327_000660 [Venturia inaequalis]